MNIPLTQKAGNPHVIINQRLSKTLPIADIVMCEGFINYTLIYMRNGRKIFVSHTLKSFEMTLTNMGFNRVHRKYLINYQRCMNFDRDNSCLTMENGIIVNISRRRINSFFKWQLLF